MALVAWHDRFMTGIPTIDEQHRTLFTAVNDFYAGLQSGQPRDHVGKTLDFLVVYTARHFRTEEEAMQRHAYPERAAHSLEHYQLIQDVGVFKEQWDRQAANLRTLEVARFLGDWLTQHIQVRDMAFAQYLKGLGLTNLG
ncbi:bacteriohemerythrin [Mesoterricola sediminis]|uniref:Hemerythrin-like domain-containing protein n=1 Tax=Mesoterricola sediminis TaxID=2927980 RepID=A0AA48KF50_9BACT|nr:bacteriohemerythrin [Mesoterricola sediminis]BDU77962.1 hypothetical protein METESE_29200 [Mesoterricola sediminis]